MPLQQGAPHVDGAAGRDQVEQGDAVFVGAGGHRPMLPAQTTTAP